jgi:hypothetical protein
MSCYATTEARGLFESDDASTRHFYRNLLIPTSDFGLPTASTRLAPINFHYQYLDMVVQVHSASPRHKYQRNEENV